MSDTVMILALILLALVWFVGGYNAGQHFGAKSGRLQVASGQYECTLETQADKTTSWKCEEVK